MGPIRFRVQFISPRKGEAGCFVQVVELGTGELSLTLYSCFRPDEVVDKRIVNKIDLADALDSWVDY